MCRVVSVQVGGWCECTTHSGGCWLCARAIVLVRCWNQFNPDPLHLPEGPDVWANLDTRALFRDQGSATWRMTDMIVDPKLSPSGDLSVSLHRSPQVLLLGFCLHLSLCLLSLKVWSRDGWMERQIGRGHRGWWPKANSYLFEFFFGPEFTIHIQNHSCL